MTLHDAIRMMGTRVSVAVRSDAALATTVANKQAAYALAHPQVPTKAVVTPATGANAPLELRPIAAMLELARGTALSDDPEIAAFARRWSILRHLGVFDRNPQDGSLRLDAGTLQFIGPNQRRVLSEELGIGFGILVAKRWCRARTPAIGPITAIDVDKALHNGTVPNLQLAGGRQPDYLLAYPDPTTPGTMAYDLLETKGTVRRSTANGQLGRAVTQLAGLTVGGQPLTGIAISTISTSDGFLVLAVDPEERPIRWKPTETALDHWRTATPRPRKDEPIIDIEADELFARATNVDYAALATFSGLREASKRWLPTEEAPHQAVDVVRRTTESGTFIGAEFVVEVPGTTARVSVYQGVEHQVADGLRALDASAVLDAQIAFAAANGDIDAEPTPSSANGDGSSAAAVSSDGSILEIRVA